MAVLNDREIAELCRSSPPLVVPFVPCQEGKPSYGLGSFGYDVRLGRRFLVPADRRDVVLDPLRFPPGLFQEVEADRAFALAPHTMVLAESVEWVNMPDDVLGLVTGKSSYARCGLVMNMTPLEPGWRGRLTIELVNRSPYPIRLHVGQGIAQILFFRGERPTRIYGEKEAGGRYQDQLGVTLPR